MLPPRILHHVEVKSAAFYPVAELEHFELAPGSLLLLLCQIREDILHVLSCMLLFHFFGDLGSRQLCHHMVDSWHFVNSDLGVDSAELGQSLQGLYLSFELFDTRS